MYTAKWCQAKSKLNTLQDYLPNHFQWFAEFELRELISKLPDVISVIDSNKTALCSPADNESKGHLWMFSVLMRRPFPEAGLQIEGLTFVNDMQIL